MASEDLEKILAPIGSVHAVGRAFGVLKVVIEEELRHLISCGLALREGNRVLGLAIPPISIEGSAIRKIQMRKPVNQQVVTTGNANSPF